MMQILQRIIKSISIDILLKNIFLKDRADYTWGFQNLRRYIPKSFISVLVLMCVLNAHGSQDVVESGENLDELTDVSNMVSNIDVMEPNDIAPDDSSKNDEEDDDDEPTLMDSTDVNTGSAEKQNFFKAQYTPPSEDKDETV